MGQLRGRARSCYKNTHSLGGDKYNPCCPVGTNSYCWRYLLLWLTGKRQMEFVPAPGRAWHQRISDPTQRGSADALLVSRVGCLRLSLYVHFSHKHFPSSAIRCFDFRAFSKHSHRGVGSGTRDSRTGLVDSIKLEDLHSTSIARSGTPAV